MKTALITTNRWYATSALVLASEKNIAAADLSSFNLPPYNCPYGLRSITEGDTVFIHSTFLHYLERQGVDLALNLIAPLRQRYNTLIGLDDTDAFNLSLNNVKLSFMDSLLKVNGLYIDHDLYNFVSGALNPSMQWTSKNIPQISPYDPINIEKLRLWAPCFLSNSSYFKSAVRRLYNLPVPHQLRGKFADIVTEVSLPISKSKPPKNTVHFLGSLTNMQRATATRMMCSSKLQWIGGITGVSTKVAALAETGVVELSETERDSLLIQLQKEHLTTAPLSRFKYQASMAQCKAVLSVAGHGEICYRMAEAWAARRVLVCQDLSHVKTLFPFKHGHNVVFCRSDLTNLVDILEDIECNFGNYINIAVQGYHDWNYWSRHIMRDLSLRLQEVVKN